MTDEKFAEFIKKTAQDYNRPPEAPRAEMWARIEAVRAKRRGERELERQARPWLRWGLAAAAVLAVGIGIGRVTAPPNGSETSTVAAATADLEEPNGLMFQVAATEYLARTDAFLSLFRSEARLGTADVEVAEWARDLLSMARLMMDSPAAEDVMLRELLEDLELILVQIAQYTSSENSAELDLIEQGLEERGVLLRLQAVLARGDDAAIAQGAI